MNSVHISFSFTISCVLCALCLFIIDVTSRGYVWEANEERNWHPLLTLARWHLVGYPGWKGDTVSFTCNPVDSTGPLACNSWSRLILAPWLVILQLLCLLFLNIANFRCFGFFHVSFHSNPPCDYHTSTCNSVSAFISGWHIEMLLMLPNDMQSTDADILKTSSWLPISSFVLLLFSFLLLYSHLCPISTSACHFVIWEIIRRLRANKAQDSHQHSNTTIKYAWHVLAKSGEFTHIRVKMSILGFQCILKLHHFTFVLARFCTNLVYRY